MKNILRLLVNDYHAFSKSDFILISYNYCDILLLLYWSSFCLGLVQLHCQPRETIERRVDVTLCTAG